MDQELLTALKDWQAGVTSQLTGLKSEITALAAYQQKPGNGGGEAACR